MSLKFISQTAHGIIDWMTVPILACVPRALGYDRPATRLFDVGAGGIAVSSALTDYPAGLVKLMPMKTHLMLDKMTGGVFLASAAVMEDEPPLVRTCLGATGLFLLLTGFCTRTQPQAQAPRRGAYARQGPIERYAEQTRPDIYGRQPNGTTAMEPIAR